MWCWCLLRSYKYTVPAHTGTVFHRLNQIPPLALYRHISSYRNHTVIFIYSTGTDGRCGIRHSSTMHTPYLLFGLLQYESNNNLELSQKEATTKPKLRKKTHATCSTVVSVSYDRQPAASRTSTQPAHNIGGENRRQRTCK